MALSKRLEDGAESLQRLPAQTTASNDEEDTRETLGLGSYDFQKKILIQEGKARRVDFVGDQYPDISIKGIKRERRSNTGQLAVAITSS